MLKCEMDEWKNSLPRLSRGQAASDTGAKGSAASLYDSTRSQVRANVSANAERAGGVVTPAAVAPPVPPVPSVMPVAGAYSPHAGWDVPPAPVSSGWGVPSVSPGWSLYGHPAASAVPAAPPSSSPEAHADSKSPWHAPVMAALAHSDDAAEKGVVMINGKSYKPC